MARRQYGSGYLITRDNERMRVDVLPPAHAWRGDGVLVGRKPDARAWVVFVNAEEFARVERREDILPFVLSLKARRGQDGWLAHVHCCEGGRFMTDKEGTLQLQASGRWAIMRRGREPFQLTSCDDFRVQAGGMEGLQLTRMEHLYGEGSYSIDGFNCATACARRSVLRIDR